MCILFRYDTVEKTHDPDREKRILERLQKNIDKKKHKQEKAKPAATVVADEEAAAEAFPDEDEETKHDNDAVHEEEPTKTSAVALSTTTKTNEADSSSNFQVLGTDRFRNKQRIDMVLPPWLASPTIISNELPRNASTDPSSSASSAVAEDSIDGLPYLSDGIKAALHSFGIHALFPVQRAVIPWIIDAHRMPDPFRPRDICVSAPTGSGKTFAYAVPIVQCLQPRLERRIRALIVLPVNELAVQVLKQFRKLCEGTTLTCGLLSKAVPFEAEQAQLVEQFEGEWYSRVDIVVATTGRLVEHLSSTPGFCLKSLQFLVMDEADRIMEQIQNNWLYHLDAHVKEQSDAFLHGRAVPLCFAELCQTVDRQPHKLLFSATLSQDPEKLKNLQLFQPKLFTAIVKPFESGGGDAKGSEQRGDFVGKFTTPAGLTEKYCMTQAGVKPLTLYALIKAHAWKRWLCFTNSGLTAHRLVFVLQQLFGADARIEELSSSLLTPEKRNAVLVQFQTGQINGLVCSDALARGIDVEGIDVVISYEMPRHIKTYVHRVGRTARAGREGMAVTLLEEHEEADFKVWECRKVVPFPLRY